MPRCWGSLTTFLVWEIFGCLLCLVHICCPQLAPGPHCAHLHIRAAVADGQAGHRPWHRRRQRLPQEVPRGLMDAGKLVQGGAQHPSCRRQRPHHHRLQLAHHARVEVQPDRLLSRWVYSVQPRCNRAPTKPEAGAQVWAHTSIRRA